MAVYHEGFNLVIENLLISTISTEPPPIKGEQSFNLVIENLLISTRPPHINACDTIKFQSRNRESSNFNVLGNETRLTIYPRFNLVIENLLISTPQYSQDGEDRSKVSIS